MERIIEKRARERQRVIEEARQWARSLEGPVTVILVGSYARGDFNAWSDVDLLVVSPVFRGVRVIDRLLGIDTPPGYEVIAVTPEELERMIAKKNPLVVDASRHGIVLRDDLGVSRLLKQLGTQSQENSPGKAGRLSGDLY